MPIDDTSRQLFMNVNLDFWIKVFFILFIVFYIVKLPLYLLVFKCCEN